LCSCFVPVYKPNPERAKECWLAPQTQQQFGKKTLVLDLDETLVHSSFNPNPTSDIIIQVDINGMNHFVYILKRPGVNQFLEALADDYEIIIYTASLSKYASPLLDLIDKKKVISGRLYRQHCTFFNGTYVKDLSLLGRDLESVLIVDNSPIAYSFNPDNAIPISSWFEDPNDRELFDLIPILKALAKESSIPNTLRELKQRKLEITLNNLMELCGGKNLQQQVNDEPKRSEHNSPQDRNRAYFNSPMGSQAEKIHFNFE